MQLDANATAQLPPAPLKPTCTLLFKTGPCADSWRNYNQAMTQWAQLYVKHQQSVAASEATAPLLQQISELNKATSDLNQQIVTMQQAAVQATAAAHTQGLEQGAGIGVGASLVLLALILGIKKLMSDFTVSKKPQAKAASA